MKYKKVISFYGMMLTCWALIILSAIFVEILGSAALLMCGSAIVLLFINMIVDRRNDRIEYEKRCNDEYDEETSHWV